MLQKQNPDNKGGNDVSKDLAQFGSFIIGSILGMFGLSMPKPKAAAAAPKPAEKQPEPQAQAEPAKAPEPKKDLTPATEMEVRELLGEMRNTLGDEYSINTENTGAGLNRYMFEKAGAPRITFYCEDGRLKLTAFNAIRAVEDNVIDAVNIGDDAIRKIKDDYEIAWYQKRMPASLYEKFAAAANRGNVQIDQQESKGGVYIKLPEKADKKPNIEMKWQRLPPAN